MASDLKRTKNRTFVFHSKVPSEIAGRKRRLVFAGISGNNYYQKAQQNTPIFFSFLAMVLLLCGYMR